MIFHTGSLFDTKLMAIGHGCNARGVMGAGIAKQFKEKFPENYYVYRSICRSDQAYIGNIWSTHIIGSSITTSEAGRVICNLITQDAPGPNAKLEYIYDASVDAARRLSVMGINRLAIPKIGCGIGGLNWRDVSSVLLEVEKQWIDNKFEFEVWDYNV